MKWGSCSTCDVITCQQTFASAKLSVNGDEWKNGQAAKSGRGCRCKGGKIFQLDFISLPTLRFLSLSFRAWYRLVKNGNSPKTWNPLSSENLNFKLKFGGKILTFISCYSFLRIFNDNYSRFSDTYALHAGKQNFDSKNVRSEEKVNDITSRFCAI